MGERISRWRGPLRAPLILAAVLVLAVTAFAWRPAPLALSHTFDSPEALAQAVLDGLTRQDHAGLTALALNDEEFRRRVWPELPASRPERNVPLDYAWTDLRQKSGHHLAQTLAKHGGHRYELVSVRFRGETTTYGTFSVARKAELLLRDTEGDEQRVRLFGSVLIDGSRYKLFSYVVD